MKKKRKQKTERRKWNSNKNSTNATDNWFNGNKNVKWLLVMLNTKSDTKKNEHSLAFFPSNNALVNRVERISRRQS